MMSVVAHQPTLTTISIKLEQGNMFAWKITSTINRLSEMSRKFQLINEMKTSRLMLMKNPKVHFKEPKWFRDECTEHRP